MKAIRRQVDSVRSGDLKRARGREEEGGRERERDREQSDRNPKTEIWAPAIIWTQARPNRFLQRRTLCASQTEALFVCAATFMYIMNRTIKHYWRDAQTHTHAHRCTRSKLGMTCWRSLTFTLFEQKHKPNYTNTHTEPSYEIVKWKKRFVYLHEWRQTPLFELQHWKTSRPFLRPTKKKTP